MVSRQLYQYMIDNITEGIYFVDTERKITFWNKGAERITGYKANEVLNSHCYDNVLNHVDSEGTQLCIHGCPLHASMEDTQIREASVFLHHKEGHRVPVRVRVIPIVENGRVVGGVELFTDEAERHTMQEDLERYKELAYKDQLTGLANRRYTENYIDSKLKEMRYFDIPVAIALLDIDDFKKVNDTYGHIVGDKILSSVSNTLRQATRNTDLISRWGGEEFLIVFPGVDNSSLEKVSKKINSLVKNTWVEHQGQRVSVTISIGATLANDEDNIESVIDRADKLLYKCKNSGKDGACIG